MECNSTGRFNMRKQSSLAPEDNVEAEVWPGDVDGVDVPVGIEFMYLANEGDVVGIRELLASGVDVNFRDSDGRTALHVAACQGLSNVVQLLLENGAEVGPEDRWGSTPLADAIHYKNHEVIKLLEKRGAKLLIAPMHVKNSREVPEYEIDPGELDFTNSVNITKGTFRVATWRGIKVAVKKLADDVITHEDKIRAFRDELALLQLIRHPNVVQFLGAVTQSSPLMIVTEYLPKGDLRDFLKQKGALKPALAVRFALDIARGMNYLHEHKPEAIIHCDLEPSNILRDDSGHLKVADFDISKLLKVAKTIREDRPLTFQDTACRYIAPEVIRNEEYDTKVDVFSFSLILQEGRRLPHIYSTLYNHNHSGTSVHHEMNFIKSVPQLEKMIEGCLPFSHKQDNEVPKAYASKERPLFRAPSKLYAYGLKVLLEQCWSENPADRPTFKEIIDRLTIIQTQIAEKRCWKVKPLKCFRNLGTLFKKDHSDPSSCSSRSSLSSDYF